MPEHPSEIQKKNGHQLVIQFCLRSVEFVSFGAVGPPGSLLLGAFGCVCLYYKHTIYDYITKLRVFAYAMSILFNLTTKGVYLMIHNIYIYMRMYAYCICVCIYGLELWPQEAPINGNLTWGP